jgi:hypothetical protein
VFRSRETEPWLERANGVEDEMVRTGMGVAKEDMMRVGLRDVWGRLQIAKKRE